MTDKSEVIKQIESSWQSKRWIGIKRTYSAEDVCRLRGSLLIEYTFAKHGAERLWYLLNTKPFIHALGALSGQQAVQMAKAGLEAIYVSGWQVAADANANAQTYPDQGLYAANSVPQLVKRINFALQRADQIEHLEGKNEKDWYLPLVADAEAGFGGVLNVFELMKEMIEAGAAAVHFEDQLSSAKKCGHLGGKVIIPINEFIKKLIAARLAADIADIPTVLIARTDAESATLLANDIDERDRQFITGERTEEGFFRIQGGIKATIVRGLAYAPYADILWCETSRPDLKEAREFAESIHRHFPDKILAYNCSPSFNWKKNLDQGTISKFQQELSKMNYKFQFVTLAGFHALNYSTFKLAKDYNDRDMAAYVELQEAEFAAEQSGYTATRHQREVGTGYFDLVSEVVSGGDSSTTAMHSSTEKHQF